MRWIGLLFLLIPVCSWAAAPIPFANISFGQPPEASMVCVKGPCSTTPLRPDVPAARIDFAMYVKPVDITTFAGWEIASPKYMFYKNHLVRIGFQMNCEPDNHMRCMDDLSNSITETFNGKLVGDKSLEHGQETAMEIRRFLAGGDTSIEIIHKKRLGNWEQPIVNIESQSRMEALRNELSAGLQ